VLDLFRQRLLRGRATNEYPEFVEAPPPAFRGMPRLREDRCSGNAACVAICPSRAITVSPLPEAGWTWTLDRAACLGCGRCAEVCPTEALEIENIFELASRSRDALRVSHAIRPDAPSGGLQQNPPVESLGGKGRDQTSRLFVRSLQLRHLDVGSCNGCDWEINALLNPVYDLQRFGVDIVASPRHADGLLVTGPVTRHLEPALWATYEATPDPKLVIAVGACAGESGWLAGSYAVAGGVDRRLPVDVYIPGCPPRPEAILRGILLAMGRCSSR